MKLFLDLFYFCLIKEIIDEPELKEEYWQNLTWTEQISIHEFIKANWIYQGEKV